MNTKGKLYENSLQIQNKILDYALPLDGDLIFNITGSGDPFGSKVFRDFLTSFDGNKQTLDLEINTKIEKFVSSKDTQGNPKTFRIELSTMLKIYDSKKLIFTNNFLEISNYNNMSSKFDLKTYENKIENNLLEKISEDIIIFLETLSI